MKQVQNTTDAQGTRVVLFALDTIKPDNERFYVAPIKNSNIVFAEALSIRKDHISDRENLQQWAIQTSLAFSHELLTCVAATYDGRTVYPLRKVLDLSYTDRCGKKVGFDLSEIKNQILLSYLDFQAITTLQDNAGNTNNAFFYDGTTWNEAMNSLHQTTGKSMLLNYANGERRILQNHAGGVYLSQPLCSTYDFGHLQEIAGVDLIDKGIQSVLKTEVPLTLYWENGHVKSARPNATVLDPQHRIHDIHDRAGAKDGAATPRALPFLTSPEELEEDEQRHTLESWLEEEEHNLAAAHTVMHLRHIEALREEQHQETVSLQSGR